MYGKYLNIIAKYQLVPWGEIILLKETKLIGRAKETKLDS